MERNNYGYNTTNNRLDIRGNRWSNKLSKLCFLYDCKFIPNKNNGSFRKNRKEEKMNIKTFFKKWKEGILTLSQEKQLKAKLIGLVGGIFGLILALISMLYKEMWGFSIFVFFIIWLQVITYIGTRQQYKSIKEMMKELKPPTQDEESPKIDNELGNAE